MILEDLGRIDYFNNGFLIGIEHSLQKLSESNKKIVLFGVCDNSFFAEKLLSEVGLEIYAYADNSPMKQGKMFRGKKVYSPYQLFKTEDVYFIISVPNKFINNVRQQFLLHEIESYSVFFRTHFHDFADEDLELYESLIESINKIAFENRTKGDALPYAVWGDGGQLGNINYLCNSTQWSAPSYIWEKQFLERNQNANILEIGPGFGLMSLVLLKLFPQICIDWYLLGNEENYLDIEDNHFYSSLKRIKKEYGNQIDVICGYIEKDEYKIEKQYDLIILTEVFEHFVFQPIDTMKKLANALTDTGRIILSTPDWGPTNLYEKWEDLPRYGEMPFEKYLHILEIGGPHIYQYNKDEMLKIFEASGLEVEKYELSDVKNHNFVLKRKENISS